jgi:uncharacterized membrane protein YoaK (UPF0700 family)/ketosteroid isomerase-like protein
MPPRTPEEATVVAFNACINARDLDGLTHLMSDDHEFVDTAGHVVAGRAACTDAWRDFFGAFPDYRNRFTDLRTTAPGVVEIDGASECSVAELDGPAHWRAVVVDGRVREWRVDEVAPESLPERDRATGNEAQRRHVVVLLLLVLATGVIDAACLLHLGVFTAYITGALIVFAGQLVGADSSAWPAATAIVAFLVGAFAGARLVRREAPTHHLFAGNLLLVAAVVAAGALIAAVVGIDDDAGSYPTIALLAIAMGLQLAVIRRAAMADIVLPAATLVTFNLIADSPAAGGTPHNTARRVGVVAALLGGALLGAGVARWEPWAAWAVAAFVVATAATTAYVSLPRSVGSGDATG